VYSSNFIQWFGDWTAEDKTDVSKVVDENGEPLVVYHGQVSTFKEFHPHSSARYDKTLENGLKKKFYATSNKNIASQFAVSDDDFLSIQVLDLANEGVSESEIASNLNISVEKVQSLLTSVDDNIDDKVYPIFLNIRNPLKIDAKKVAVHELGKDIITKINNSEGVIITNVLESLDSNILEKLPYEFTEKVLDNPYTTDYIVSNPNQIKSATYNNGEFS
jgi:transcriptional regulator